MRTIPIWADGTVDARIVASLEVSGIETTVSGFAIRLAKITT